MSLSCECCVLPDRGPCVGLVTRPEESYRVWYAWTWKRNLNSEEALAKYLLERPKIFSVGVLGVVVLAAFYAITVYYHSGINKVKLMYLRQVVPLCRWKSEKRRDKGRLHLYGIRRVKWGMAKNLKMVQMLEFLKETKQRESGCCCQASVWVNVRCKLQPAACSCLCEGPSTDHCDKKICFIWSAGRKPR
jgi:hypothetical protein